VSHIRGKVLFQNKWREQSPREMSQLTVHQVGFVVRPHCMHGVQRCGLQVRGDAAFHQHSLIACCCGTQQR